MRGRGVDVDSSPWTGCIVAGVHTGVLGSWNSARPGERDTGAEWEGPIACGHAECVQALLDAGARPDQASDSVIVDLNESSRRAVEIGAV